MSFMGTAMSASCSSKIFAPSAKQIFRRGVDRLSCRNGTIAKMKYGDLAGVRIAVDDELVRGEEKPRRGCSPHEPQALSA